MPNYNIVIDTSNFKPFDISPALTILNAYAEKRKQDLEVYDRIAQLLGELATAVLGNKITKEIWDNYNGDLQAAMSDFALGSSQATGRALSAMRLRYFKDIVPIELARAAMLKNLEAIRAKDDGSLIHEDLGNLDYYYQHPDYVPRMYDAKLLRTQVETIMSNIAKGMVSMDKLGDLDPYTYKIITRTGFNPKDILAAMANYLATGDTKNPIMLGVLDAVWESTFNGWNMTDDIRRKGRSWMAQGLSAGSESKVEHMLNWGALKSREEAFAIRMENLKYKHELEKAQLEAQKKAAADNDKKIGELMKKRDMLSSDAIDDTFGISAAEAMAKRQTLLNNGMLHAIRNGYITKNAKGEYVVTKKGVDTYNVSGTPLKVNNPRPTTGGAGYIPPAPTPRGEDMTWRSFVDEVLGDNGSIKAALSGGRSYMKEGSDLFSRRWRKVLKEVDEGVKNPDNYNNAYTTSSKLVRLNNLTEGLRSVSGTTHKAKWDTKNHKWISTGKVFNQEDLESAKGRLYVGVNNNQVFYKYIGEDGKTQILIPGDPYYIQHNPKGASAVAASTRLSLSAMFKDLINAVNSGNMEEARRQANKANEYIAKYNTLPALPADERIRPIDLNNLQITADDLARIEMQALQDAADIYDYLSSLDSGTNILEDTNQFNSQSK